MWEKVYTKDIVITRLFKGTHMLRLLRDGDIIEQGNHEYFMKQNVFYAELYQSRFELRKAGRNEQNTQM